jgi:aryl-alcohol dehydrogenase-like predicted oxidoreductase
MQKRALGKSGLSIAPLVFGGNVFGWTADEKTSFALLDAFVDAGFDCIDTADVYTAWIPGHKGGESETVIGNWLAATAKRDKVTIATKVGMKLAEGQGLSRGWIMRSVEDSLRRLRTDRIDLYQSHKDDPETPLDETLEAFARLVEQGKVRAIGASNYDAPRLAGALDIAEARGEPRYETLQPLYNLMDRAGFERELAQLCIDRQVAVIPFYSLAAGFLTGKYRSKADLAKSPRGGGVGQKYLNERGLRVLAALDAVAAEIGAKPGQVALAWLLAKPAVTAPIASATTLEQLDELVMAVRLTLSDETVRRLDAASA